MKRLLCKLFGHAWRPLNPREINEYLKDQIEPIPLVECKHCKLRPTNGKAAE